MDHKHQEVQHTDLIEQRVRACLLSHTHNATLNRILVGFSGGADSTALLVAAARVIAADFPGQLELLALHIHHGLQAAADDWQAHCTRVCKRLGVTLHCEQVAVARQGNVEANARQQRYAQFARLSDAGTLLLLGHHQHDQSETILYRLFQGRGVLPMRGEGAVGEGRFARPLLSVPPTVLREYLQRLDVPWVEDHSNTDVRLTRNFLRHEVVPLLSRHWRELHQALLRVGRAQAAAQTALEYQLSRLPDTVPLADLPQGAAAVAWLRAYLHGRGVYGVSDKALVEFTEQLGAAERAHCDCGDGRSLRSYDGMLHFVAPVRPASVGRVSSAVGESVALDGGTLALNPTDTLGPGVMCCYGRLQIGYRAGGERVQMKGFSKSLKQLFAEARVPTWQRDYYPLLFDGDELVCVPNLAVAASRQSDDRARALTAGEPSPGQFCVAVWAPN